ncbi:SAM domain-containing protein [Mycena indigotica]|uniref:SAM domain-containing protein n=1 Tax=Mycena indigotica TaxID=2126181 RepID=A0A8H6RYI8_9AGAR|nr:SAM domain-containing protein [Mycena indigotica]KAF7289222.1 SAM domain-containing protein [Mycena indigotica]
MAGNYPSPSLPPSQSLAVAAPFEDPDNWGMLGADYGTEHAKAIPRYTTGIPIPGTNYMCVIWANRSTMISGVWQYHIAQEQSPLVPLAISSLQRNGVTFMWCTMGDWQNEPDAGAWSTTKTLLGTPGHLVGLKINGKRYEASEAFPDAPRHDTRLVYIIHINTTSWTRPGDAQRQRARSRSRWADIGPNIRVGDGEFQENRDGTMQQVHQKLTDELLKLNLSSQRPPLYTSTHVPNAATDPLFATLRQSFSWTYFLSDFPAHHLAGMRNTYDGLAMWPAGGRDGSGVGGGGGVD